MRKFRYTDKLIISILRQAETGTPLPYSATTVIALILYIQGLAAFNKWEVVPGTQSL